MTDEEHVKTISDLLRNDPHLHAPTPLVRRHPTLPGVWVDRRGYIWTSIKAEIQANPVYFLKRLPVFEVSRNRKARVFDSGLRKYRQMSVGRVVLEAWVGPGPGPDRTAYRIPCPHDTGWPYPDAPETLCWSPLRPTDDLTVYLAAPHILDAWIIWPGPSDYIWDRDPDNPDAVKKVYLPRRQVRLRDEYKKILHPQLTEQNQAPMIPLPG